MIFQTINLPNPWRVIWCKQDIIHYSKKFLNKWLITNPTELVVIKTFDQENLITQRLLFTIRIAHSKTGTHEHPTFGQYVFNNTKALTKVTKDHQKKPKSLLATIIFNRLTVTINDEEPIQKSLSVLIRALHVTISFNDTGFCSCLLYTSPSPRD